MKRRRANNRRRLSLEPLECRRVLAASLGWDGPGQGSADLTYYIANHPSSLSQAETEAAIETALDAWSSVVDVTFTQTDQPGLRDSIDISFTSIDGTGGTLGQAHFPDDANPARIAGDIQFDIAEAWEVGHAPGSQAFDLVYVAAHEIGHSLGLDHSSAANSVLAPFVSPLQVFPGLTDSDVAAIQQLYAAVAPTTASADDGVEIVIADDPQASEGASSEVPADEAGTTENETVDSADHGTDTLDDSVEPSASSDEDDDEESDDEESDENADCDRPRQRYRGVSDRNRLPTKNAPDVLSRFDSDQDGSLNEDEVPDRLWNQLADLAVDADGDGQVTETELDAAITALRQERFDAKDLDEDGLLIEDEVGERFWNKVSDADTDADQAITFDEWDTWLDTTVVEPRRFDRVFKHHHGAADAVFSAIHRFRQLR